MDMLRGLDESDGVRLERNVKGRTATTLRLPGLWDNFGGLVSSASGLLPARIRRCDEHSGELPSAGAVEAASASFRRSTHRHYRPNGDTR